MHYSAPIIATLLLLTGCGLPGGGFIRARSQGQLTACKSNLKNLATACEMYATDFGGRYPPDLARLTAQGKFTYLKFIPICPAASSDTYSSTYKSEVARRDKQGKILSGRDYFEFHCSGNHHKEVQTTEGPFPPDKPAYNSTAGLIDH